MVLEAGVRIVDPLGISYFEESERYNLMKEADKDLVFRHTPGIKGTYFGVEVETNDLGMRDRPIELKKEGEIRVLTLGDSVTFGVGVKEPETFPRRLEANLNGNSNGVVRIINAGVGGYNTQQEWGFLSLKGEDIAPDIVVLLYVYNDFEVNKGPYDPRNWMSIENKSPPQVISVLLGRIWLYRLMTFTLNYSGRTGADITGLQESEGWQESMDSLGKIADWCARQEIPFVVFVYRMHETPLTRACYESVKDVGLSEGFPVLDTLPWFASKDFRAITNSVVDPHPNAEGHSLLAKGILQSFERLGIDLPP